MTTAITAFGRLYAAGYDFVSGRIDAQGGAEHRDRLVAGAHGDVLEIGAGTGRNLRRYEDAKVVALEPEAAMRARAERRAERSPVAVEVVEGDAMSLPFPAASFDTVVASLVLCSIPEPGQALDEVRRVLRPGGTFRFYEHVRAAEPSLASRQDRWERAWRWFGRGCHPNRDTIAVIQGAGFKIHELEHFNVQGAPALTRPHVLGTARPCA